MYRIWILNKVLCVWSVMWFLAAYHPEFFAILADTLEVTLCYSSSENRLVNQSRPILSENEIGYFNTTKIKEALCNSQCSDTHNNFPNYRETNWSGNSQDSRIRKGQMCAKNNHLYKSNDQKAADDTVHQTRKTSEGNTTNIKKDCCIWILNKFWYALEMKCAETLHCPVAAAGRVDVPHSSNFPGVVVLSSGGPLQSSSHERRQLVLALPRPNLLDFFLQRSLKWRISIWICAREYGES